MDNGFLKLRRVRVPRRNLGMRFIHVDSKGAFKKKVRSGEERKTRAGREE